MNPSNMVGDPDIHAEARWISCEESDLCWEIIEVSENNLILSFAANGRNLNYTKLKK